MANQTAEQDGAAVLKKQIHYTTDLLRSLQESIHRLRNQAETLRQQLEADGTDEAAGGKCQIGKLEQLIRDCQKVEKVIAEQSTEFADMLKSENQLDLDAAREDVESRLSSIRAILAPELVSG